MRSTQFAQEHARAQGHACTASTHLHQQLRIAGELQLIVARAAYDLGLNVWDRFLIQHASPSIGADTESILVHVQIFNNRN